MSSFGLRRQSFAANLNEQSNTKEMNIFMSRIELHESDEEIRRRRRQRIEEMRRAREREAMIRRFVIPGAALLLLLIVIVVVICVKAFGSKKPEEVIPESTTVSEIAPTVMESSSTEEASEEIEEGYVLQRMDTTEALNFSRFEGNISSTYGVFIDADNGIILAGNDYNERIVPASMTKIMTVLTAAKALGITGENWAENPVLQDTFTITREITDYSFVHECSNVGFEVGEAVPVIELFYGTIMPSGADAALGLAYYVAGSQEAFMELVNQDLAELGLSQSSHFTNCIGLYEKDHYSTSLDIAIMMKAVMDNPFLRDVLSAHVREIPASELHPNGIILSNLFLRRIEDRDTHGEVIGAKTGFVNQSKNCCVSLAEDKNGKEYICVTIGAEGKWKCIDDHMYLYQKYLPE